MATQDHAASMVAGGFAGVASTCMTNPLDVLRSRLAASRGATGEESKSLICHVKKLFGDGFFRGATVGLKVNALASIPSNAIYLSSYRTLSLQSKAVFGQDSTTATVVSAGGAVAATNITLAPLFVLRTRIQIDGTQTVTSVFKDVMKRDGVRGFWRGTLTNMSGRMVEEATFWTLYETSKRLADRREFGNGGFLMDTIAVFGLSSMAKLVGTSISYPYNVIMTHLREVDKATGTHQHTKIAPTIRYVYQQDGLRGFYKGLAPHLLRCVISKSVQVYAFECGLLMYAFSLRAYRGTNDKKENVE